MKRYTFTDGQIRKDGAFWEDALEYVLVEDCVELEAGSIVVTREQMKDLLFLAVGDQQAALLKFWGLFGE